jgi:hypothetical protein
MWLCDIHMKPLLRSTALMGESPAVAAALVSAFWLTGIHCSTISRSLQQLSYGGLDTDIAAHSSTGPVFACTAAQLLLALTSVIAVIEACASC